MGSFFNPIQKLKSNQAAVEKPAADHAQPQTSCVNLLDLCVLTGSESGGLHQPERLHSGPGVRVQEEVVSVFWLFFSLVIWWL